jgi:hypothetical protein
MTKKHLIFVSIFALVVTSFGVSLVPKVSAHRSGCHRWHSCPSDTGSYVCGDLGYYSGCPGGAPSTKAVPKATPTPAVHVPVITMKVITSDEPVQFSQLIRYTGKEYPPYEKLLQTGQSGLIRNITEVTYTDGAESSRASTSKDVIAPTVDQVIVKGNRTIPTAKITKLHQTKKKDKYDVIGTYKPNSTVVLAIDGKRIKRAKTNTKGEFMFKQIKLDKATYALEIFNRVNSKETKVSEKYFVQPKKNSMITEYNQNHGHMR